MIFKITMSQRRQGLYIKLLVHSYIKTKLFIKNKNTVTVCADETELYEHVQDSSVAVVGKGQAGYWDIPA